MDVSFVFVDFIHYTIALILLIWLNVRVCVWCGRSLFFYSCFLSDFADVRGITNKKTVLEGYGNVQAALLDYTLTCYSSVTVSKPGN